MPKYRRNHTYFRFFFQIQIFESFRWVGPHSRLISTNPRSECHLETMVLYGQVHLVFTLSQRLESPTMLNYMELMFEDVLAPGEDIIS